MDVAVRDINADLQTDIAVEREFDDSSPEAMAPLTSVLAELGERVAPVAMARERILPTSADLAGRFLEAGVVRGRVLSCRGVAATSAALRLAAAAVQAGAWLAVIDVPTLGLDAASELGVPLERVVAVDTTAVDESPADRAARWADAVAAAADGFEVLLTRVPAEVAAGTVRKVATRLQQRGVVLLVLGDPGVLVCDGVIDTAEQVWSGVGAGWGHLASRSVEVLASGRRLPGQRRASLLSAAS